MFIFNILFDSVILFENYYNTFTSWIGRSFTAKLCWRATRDGWSASTFHSNCDYKKPTVTIVKVGQNLFGGYATASWDSKINQSFITSIVRIFSLRTSFETGLIYILQGFASGNLKQNRGKVN